MAFLDHGILLRPSVFQAFLYFTESDNTTCPVCQTKSFFTRWIVETEVVRIKQNRISQFPVDGIQKKN